MADPNPKVSAAGLAELDAAGIATACGLLEQQARALNEGFVSRMSRGRPFVRVKLAMSLDGRTALASGESQWITGPAARRQVQHWRAQSGAVVTGIATVLADDPALDVRPADMDPAVAARAVPARQPLRVVLDSAFRTPAGARLLARDGPVLVVGCTRGDHATKRLGPRAEVVSLDATNGRPDLPALLALLAAREVNDVLVEAGPTLAGAFVSAGLVDELLIFAAPTLLGPDARPLLHLPGLDRMAERPRLHIEDVARVGDDLVVRVRPQP
jgi:diaminohydroxyphosphoribosylaminopyrimidine deaminase/5-amino-6-(5-phosphoribosylamino)uracil reductase